jgi:hypothetical protein
MRHLRQPRTGQRSTVVAHWGRCGRWKGPAKRNHMKIELKATPDVLVRNEGTVFLFCLLTPRAKEWIDEHVQSDTRWFGNALVVEHRYAWGLAEGMKNEGLVLAWPHAEVGWIKFHQ